MTTYKLVDYLAGAKARGDGAVIGALRRGWTQPLAIYPIVAPFLPLPPSKRAEDVSILIACLFGTYPKLGDTPLAVGMQMAAARRESRSIDMRMTALMTAPFEDLPRLLRRAVALVEVEHIAINWHHLMTDLLRWDADGQPAQRAWARVYWGGDRRPQPEAATPPKA